MKLSLKIVLSETLFFFLEQNNILFSQTYFFKIPKNLITSAYFLPRQILKNIDMPQQKPLMLHWWNLLIESLKMIMWLTVWCYLVSDLSMAKQAMLFECPQHGFSSFRWRFHIKSLYSPQSLLVHELKFPVKKIFYSYKILYKPQPKGKCCLPMRQKS